MRTKKLLHAVWTLAFFLASVCHSFAFSLEDLIKKAEKNDYKLLSLLYKVEAGRYRIRQAKAQYRPQLSFTAYYGWQEYKPYYSSEIKQLLKYYYLTLKQPLYRPEILAKIKQTELYSELDSLKVLQERQYARYLLITNLIHLAYSNKKRFLYSELLRLERERLAKARELKYRKLLSKDYFFGLEKNYEEALFNFKKADLEIEAVTSTLSLLLGGWKEKQPTLVLDKPLTALLAQGEKLRKDIGKNLEVRIANENVKIAESEVKLRKYGRYPKIDLSLSYSYTSSSAISVASRDKRAAVTLELPLFQGGYVTAWKMEAEKLKLAAEAEARATLKEKELQFEDSLNRLKQSIDKLRYLWEREKKDEEILKLLKEGLQERIKTVFDVLEQEEKVVNDKLLILEEVHTGLVSYIELLYLTANVTLSNVNSLNSYLKWCASK